MLTITVTVARDGIAAARAGLPPGRERTSAGGQRVRTGGPDPHAGAARVEGKVCSFLFVRADYIGPQPRARPREQNELLKLLLCLNPIRVVCYPKPKLENLESHACTASQTTARLWRHAAAGPQ